MPQQTISVPALETQKKRGLGAIGIGVAGAVVMCILERGSVTSMIEYAGIFVVIAILGVFMVLDVRKRMSYLTAGTQCVGRLTEDPKHVNAGSVSFLELPVQYAHTDGKAYQGKARLYIKGQYPTMAANSEVQVFYMPANPASFVVYCADCGIARGSASPV